MVYLCSATEKPRYLLRRLTNDGVMATRQPIRWLFLGRDYWRLMEWESALGPAFERINYAERLQELAMEWRQPYLDWIGRLGAQNDSLEWWTSRIAERNTLLDSLYHSICYLKIGLTYALQASGLLVISFRSQYFDLLHSFRSRNWQSAVLVREAREGHWGAGAHWFSWHTAADIRALLHDAGFTSVKLLGIGIASDIEGDPLANVAQPSKLSPGDLAQLMAVETLLEEQYAECGRYILAIAQR